jgi:hypothetical protein
VAHRKCQDRYLSCQLSRLPPENENNSFVVEILSLLEFASYPIPLSQPTVESHDEGRQHRIQDMTVR